MASTILHSIKARVIALLDDKLPQYLTYHNTAHTLYVAQMAETIGRAEGLNNDQLFLLQVAALLHDVGFVNGNANHEHEGCLIARQLLPEYNLLPTQIETICGMIMATKIPQSPKTRLEEILADADLEYLGTDRYVSIAEGLHAELIHLRGPMSELEWLRIQIEFVEKHTYFTNYCLINRQPTKLFNLHRLKHKYTALQLDRL